MRGISMSSTQVWHASPAFPASMRPSQCHFEVVALQHATVTCHVKIVDHHHPRTRRCSIAGLARHRAARSTGDAPRRIQDHHDLPRPCGGARKMPGTDATADRRLDTISRLRSRGRCDRGRRRRRGSANGICNWPSAWAAAAQQMAQIVQCVISQPYDRNVRLAGVVAVDAAHARTDSIACIAGIADAPKTGLCDASVLRQAQGRWALASARSDVEHAPVVRTSLAPRPAAPRRTGGGIRPRSDPQNSTAQCVRSRRRTARRGSACVRSRGAGSHHGSGRATSPIQAPLRPFTAQNNLTVPSALRLLRSAGDSTPSAMALRTCAPAARS